MMTKEAGSEINERDANNDKVEPAPAQSNIQNKIDRPSIFKYLLEFQISIKYREWRIVLNIQMSNATQSFSMESFQMRLPGIAKVGNDPHSEQLEASLEEEDNGEDSIEVVKAVHQEGLRLKPDREIK